MTESNYKELLKLIPEWKQMGLDGVEFENAQYKKYSNRRRELKNLCKKHGMIITKGADYHGKSVPSKIDECLVNEEILIQLKNRYSRWLLKQI